MENISVEFSTFLIVTFVNFLCDYLLAKLKKEPPLSSGTLIPPLAIIALMLYPLTHAKQSNFVSAHTEMTDHEYKYMMDNIADEELEVLLTSKKGKKHKEKILTIMDKYIRMCSLDDLQKFTNV